MSGAFKKLSITSDIEVYETEKDLSAEENSLLQKARTALQNAYAPYSSFLVGAAILLENGEVVLGNNQENAAYPSGLCAERVAIFHAGAIHPGVAVRTIAVCCKSLKAVIEKPVTPCGACRQVIAEYETRSAKPIRIIMQGEKGNVYASNGIDQLLPLMFNRNHLK
jgi:cytidine deaminase